MTEEIKQEAPKASGKTIKNSLISQVKLGFEERGVLTAMIHVNVGENSILGYGGFDLRANNSLAEFVSALLQTFNVGDWDLLRNMPCRVELQDGKVLRIAHYMEDKWFEVKVVPKEATETAEVVDTDPRNNVPSEQAAKESTLEDVLREVGERAHKIGNGENVPPLKSKRTKKSS